MTGQYLLQAVVAILAVTDPLGAAPVFTRLTEGMTEVERRQGAVRATLVVYIILAVCALAGGWLLRALAIELSALRVAGGLVITIMGLEMLLGSPTRVQRDHGQEPRPSGADGDPLLVPFALPVVAGPGAIATVIAMTARGDGLGHVIVVLLAVAVVALILLGSLLSAHRLARLTEGGYGTYLRVMGLILVAIGVQLLLGGAAQFVAGR
jgi:multiple antibiotic resistance protein